MIDQICEKAKQDPSQSQYYELSLKNEMDILRSCHENFKNWKNSPTLNQQEKALITKSKRAIEKKINELKNGTKRNNNTKGVSTGTVEQTNVENNNKTTPSNSNSGINPTPNQQNTIPQQPIQNELEQQQVIELAKQYLSSGYIHLREHIILIQQEMESISRNEQEKNRIEHLRERMQIYTKYLQELELISHSVNEISIQSIEELRNKIQFFVDQTRKDDLRIKYQQQYYNNPYQQPPPQQNINQNNKNLPSLQELASNVKENEQMIAIMQKKKAFTYAMLESSLINLPKYGDLESENKFTNVIPINQVDTPFYYPKTALPSFDNPNLFSRMDTDTLFYIFYYQQNTNQQLLAAKELKKKNWYYHTQYLTWFQPFPTTSPFDKNLPFNKGTFIFFDYENGWCQRKKDDFTFETCYLEDSSI